MNTMIDHYTRNLVLPCLVIMAFQPLLFGTIFAQTSNQIISINPDSAAQGMSGVLVTFTLATTSPPAPPANIPVLSVTIGNVEGRSVQHVSQYVVTAVFDIPSGEANGPRDAVITFPLPGGGTLVFSMSGGFTVTPGAGIPPRITRQPASRSVAPGGSATFSVTASGSPLLRFQWQHARADIQWANALSWTIDPVALRDTGSYRCIVMNDLGADTSVSVALVVLQGIADGYPITGTAQSSCYDTTRAIPCRQPGQPLYGQDAQHPGIQPSFTLSSDTLTVHDKITGLTWQRSPDTNGDGLITRSDKLTWAQAQTWPAALNAATYGGYADWRLPSIKELYSLMNFNGTDPSGFSGTDTKGLTPFIDTTFFIFAYGETSGGERIIDSQYGSSTMYVNKNWMGSDKLFGLNLADGRIKGYDLVMPGNQEKTFFIQCVRGNNNYGINDFVDNTDGTITDRATNLMWSRTDGGINMNWPEALEWTATKNAESWLGHNDWRVPNAKELQSIVDYSRSPDNTNSAAIDPLFTCTPITNEAGEPDYPCYWASTSHVAFNGLAGAAVYVAFGRAMGYLDGAWRDVHGAGCQRSDPKSGNPADFPTGRGPQGDAIRIYNAVRLVRDVSGVNGIHEENMGSSQQPKTIELVQNYPNPFPQSTSITFLLKHPASIRLSVIDLLGREIKTLFEGQTSAGGHSMLWDGKDHRGRYAGEGAYFFRLSCGNETQIRKVVFLR